MTKHSGKRVFIMFLIVRVDVRYCPLILTNLNCPVTSKLDKRVVPNVIFVRISILFLFEPD